MELQFKNCRIIDASNYQDLSEVHLQQMAISGKNGFGEGTETAEDFLTETGDGEIEEGAVELWDIVDNSNPDKVLFECWVYLADTANIFNAGTTEDTRLVMIQWGFENYSDNPALDAYIEPLHKAFNERDFEAQETVA